MHVRRLVGSGLCGRRSGRLICSRLGRRRRRRWGWCCLCCRCLRLRKGRRRSGHGGRGVCRGGCRALRLRCRGRRRCRCRTPGASCRLFGFRVRGGQYERDGDRKDVSEHWRNASSPKSRNGKKRMTRKCRQNRAMVVMLASVFCPHAAKLN